MLEFGTGALVQLLVEDVARLVPVLQRNGGIVDDVNHALSWPTTAP